VVAQHGLDLLEELFLKVVEVLLWRSSMVARTVGAVEVRVEVQAKQERILMWGGWSLRS
jgi:hypothetical protein